MEEFGRDFELIEFKPAFERKSGIKAYNKVQAVEHECLAVKAGRLFHEAVKLVLPAAQDFIGPYSAWIAAYLE